MAPIVVILNNYEEKKELQQSAATVFELLWVETRIYSRQSYNEWVWADQQACCL